MIEFSKYIYLDVYKTGSEHLKHLLSEITLDPMVQIKRHAPLTARRPYTLRGGKFTFATVRNPWDWYVSLWSYAADGKGGIHKFFSESMSQQEMKPLFDQQDPANSFRKWLRAVNDKDFMERVLGNNLPESGLAGVVGLYTFRFMRVTTPYPTVLLKSWMIKDIDAAIRYQRRFGLYHKALHSENLDAELTELAREHGEKLRFKPDAAEIIARFSRNRRNTSTRVLASYMDYYDADSIELVAARDRLITELFGYEFGSKAPPIRI